MSHTQGPWEASGTKALEYSEILAPGATQREGFYVCSINRQYYSGPMSVSCNIPRETTDANARLIAAAPDLLAACKAILKNIDRWQEGAEPAGVIESMKLYDQMKAAVEKAEGGEG